jgi:hypothetical protein
MERDPKFLIVQHFNWQTDLNDPDMILFNVNGDVILRQNEIIINKFTATIEALRFPEYFQLVSSEKQNWVIYLTSERIICKNNLEQTKGLFEFMDHIDNNGILIVVDSTGKISVDEMFKIVEGKKRPMKDFTIAFQIAYSRISSISINKGETKNGKAIPNAIELWYKDSKDKSDSQFIIYPTDLNVEKPYDLGLLLQKISLEEKLKCTEKKHQIDPTWNIGDYNSWKSTLIRLIQKPDMQAQGSGDLDSDSWDPIVFQAHPIQWLDDVFARSIKKEDRFNSSI